jgi:hypothetical protein
MTKHTIELDGTFTVSKGPRDKTWLAKVERDLSTFPAGLVLDVFLHGLKQLGADSASGATSEAEALGAMEKKLDALWAGEWSSRGEGSGVDERKRIERQIARTALKAKLGGTSVGWKEFTGLADADQAAKLDAIYAKNAAKLLPAVDSKLALLAQERADKAALAGDLDL